MDWLSFLKDFVLFFTFFLCIANMRRISNLNDIVIDLIKTCESLMMINERRRR